MRSLLTLRILISWPAAVALLLATVETKGKEPAAPAAAQAANLRLTLPPQCFAVVGQELRIYFDNLVLTQTPERYRFEVRFAGESGKPTTGQTPGEQEPRRWKFTPRADQVGTHKLTVRLLAADGSLIEEKSTELCVAPADAGSGKELALLIVGDSLTHATLYPNEWARLLTQPGNPKWTMLGTHRPASAAPGVAHEGYGGWTWRAFVSRYEPKPDRAKRIHSSPFVFAGPDGKPGLDLPRYFAEHCGGRKPDVVSFLLGINDCFAAPAGDPAALDRHIDGVFAEAEKLLAAFRQAAPDAKLAVCLTTPPNVREEAFTANYKGKYPRWGWKQIQHRLVERELKQFAGREAEYIYLVPTELDLDPVDGYPDNNGVHPNADGYKQIAATLQAWLKWRLYQTARLP